MSGVTKVSSAPCVIITASFPVGLLHVGCFAPDRPPGPYPSTGAMARKRLARWQPRSLVNPPPMLNPVTNTRLGSMQYRLSSSVMSASMYPKFVSLLVHREVIPLPHLEVVPGASPSPCG